MNGLQSDGKFTRKISKDKKNMNKMIQNPFNMPFSKRIRRMSRSCSTASRDNLTAFIHKPERKQLPCPSPKVKSDAEREESSFFKSKSMSTGVMIKQKYFPVHRCDYTPISMADKQTTIKSLEPANDKYQYKRKPAVLPTWKEVGNPMKTKFSQTKDDKYKKTLKDQFGFDPLDKIEQLKELKKIFCGPPPKVQRSCQYMEITEHDDVHWHQVDNTDDVESYFETTKKYPYDSVETSLDQAPKKIQMQNLHISEKPKVKVIAEKYSKLKKHGIEIRKLEEKIACLEYDIYEHSSKKPIQTMRAYFSLKPKYNKDPFADMIPSNEVVGQPNQKCDIPDEELKHRNQKQIEIIDGHLATNQTYLNDLRKVLRRRADIATKSNIRSIDLRMLYEIAKKEKPILDKRLSEALLSKDQLQEAKEYILREETSEEDVTKRKVNIRVKKTRPYSNLVSKSIMDELYKRSQLV